MTSRDQILSRIRNANGKASSTQAAYAAWEQLPRLYNSTAAFDFEVTVALFEDRLQDYDAIVLRCTSSEISGAILRLLKQRKKQHILIPEGIPPALLPPGFSFAPDQSFTPLELEHFEGVLTCATLAIAETGTVVLQNVAAQGRRAISLVPDYHLCIVKTSDIVATVPEAVARLQPTAHLPTTFISGPSATADIEMTRIKGVHGPRFLDVLLLD